MNNSQILNNNVQVLTDVLGLDSQLTDYIKNFQLNNNYEIKQTKSLTMDQIDKFRKLSNKLPDEFKKNLVESIIHSDIKSTDPSIIVDDIINLVNNTLETTNNTYESQFGGSNIGNNDYITDRIAIILKLDESLKNNLVEFLNNANTIETSKDFSNIRNELKSDDIDNKIQEFENMNIDGWSDSTINKYKEFKINLAKLEILAIIEKYKIEPYNKQVFDDLLELVNTTLSTNNQNNRNNLMVGGGNNTFIYFMKYNKYKEKYLKLKNIIIK